MFDSICVHLVLCFGLSLLSGHLFLGVCCGAGLLVLGFVYDFRLKLYDVICGEFYTSGWCAVGLLFCVFMCCYFCCWALMMGLVMEYRF